MIGEHADYNDGFVMPFAIEKAVYLAEVRYSICRKSVEGEALYARIARIASQNTNQ